MRSLCHFAWRLFIISSFINVSYVTNASKLTDIIEHNLEYRATEWKGCPDNDDPFEWSTPKFLSNLKSKIMYSCVDINIEELFVRAYIYISRHSIIQKRIPLTRSQVNYLMYISTFFAMKHYCNVTSFNNIIDEYIATTQIEKNTFNVLKKTYPNNMGNFVITDDFYRKMTKELISDRNIYKNLILFNAERSENYDRISQYTATCSNLVTSAQSSNSNESLLFFDEEPIEIPELLKQIKTSLHCDDKCMEQTLDNLKGAVEINGKQFHPNQLRRMITITALNIKHGPNDNTDNFNASLICNCSQENVEGMKKLLDVANATWKLRTN